MADYEISTIEPHMSVFRACSDLHSPWVGKNANRWANKVSPGLGSRFRLKAGQFSRDELRRFCGRRNTSAAACFLAVMAWGGMRLDHARAAWLTRNHWLPTLSAIRSGRLSRQACYAKFSKLRRMGRIPGVGPAYFTKLIFFTRPQEDGYIMDQWTGKSINLLVAPAIVHLSKPGYVTDSNGACDYEKFCVAVDMLASQLSIAGSEAEERLFSIGGRIPGAWRAYVRKKWMWTTRE